jgi:hypothetical protein
MKNSVARIATRANKYKPNVKYLLSLVQQGACGSVAVKALSY